MIRNIVDAYNHGVLKLIESLNRDVDTVNSKIFFNVTTRDKHVAQRMVERNINILDVITEARTIVNDKLCQLIYAAHTGKSGITVKCKSANLVFRSFYNTNRDGYEIKLTTVTTHKMSHDYDFIIE